MNHGFVRVCAATPKIQVADPEFNGNEILKLMEEGRDHHAFLMVFPELCLTGYTCNDLFWHAPLLEKAKEIGGCIGRFSYAVVCGTSVGISGKTL